MRSASPRPCATRAATALLLLLIALLLFTHSAQAHKDYRYVFAFMPLWLLVGAGGVAQLAARTGRPIQVWRRRRTAGTPGPSSA